MTANFEIVHAIPGRLRLYVPAIKHAGNDNSLQAMFESLKGIEHVRIEPVIQTMVIKYNPSELNWGELQQAADLFLNRHSWGKSMNEREKHRISLKKDLLRSAVSGILLAFTLWRRRGGVLKPDILDYLTVIATSYTVLSHGENRLTHPDVLTGIISIALTGTENILRVAFITWIVNLAEVVNDIRKGNVLPFSI